MARKSMTFAIRMTAVFLPLLLAAGCAAVDVPGGRTADIPTVTPPIDRYRALNEGYSPITRVKLGKDILVPQRPAQDPLPEVEVGPYELRGETLASALQLVLDDYDVALAFESDSAMTELISVSNLRGPLTSVVNRLCDLANLYCSYKDQIMTVKDTETFLVDLPPVVDGGSGSGDSGSDSGSSGSSSSGSDSDSGSDAPYGNIASGIEAITGGQVSSVGGKMDKIIYTATARTQKYVERFLQHIRKSTALIIFETHIWEVSLENGNRTGIDWSLLARNGNFSINAQAPGAAPGGDATPITITPTWTGNAGITPQLVLEFISEHGAVKTVSQPQLAVLSGSQASLDVRQNENYVAQVTRTPSTVDGQPDTISTTAATVGTGISMEVDCAWDQATVYASIGIDIDELLQIDTFTSGEATVQLPRTTERNLSTFVRVRPGDAILIGGLVTQKDSYDGSGPGFMRPLIQTTRGASARNTELVFLLRPRLVIYEPSDDAEDMPPVATIHPYGRKSAQAEKAAAPEEAARADFDTSSLPEGIPPAALSPRGPEPVVMPEDAEPEEDEDAMLAPAFRPEQEPAPPAMIPPSVPADVMAPVPLAPATAVPESWMPGGGAAGEGEGSP